MKFLAITPFLATVAQAGKHGDDLVGEEVPACHWTYQDTHCAGDRGPNEVCIYGPHEWSSLPSHVCEHQCDKNESQSPIDILPANAMAPSNQTHIEFSYSNGANTWKADEHDYLGLHASCEGCSLQVRASSATHPERASYTLVQTHFHTPSEHTVDGKLADGELHLVHEHEDGGAYLVVGLLLQIADEADKFASDLFGPKGFEYAVEPLGFKTLTDTGVADFESLMKQGGPLSVNATYFQYKGGFTTPPCSEIVEWYVMEKPLKVHRNTIEAHEKLNGKTSTNQALVNKVREFNEAKQESTPLNKQRPKFCIVGETDCNHPENDKTYSTGNNRPTVGKLNKSDLYKGIVTKSHGGEQKTVYSFVLLALMCM